MGALRYSSSDSSRKSLSNCIQVVLETVSTNNINFSLQLVSQCIAKLICVPVKSKKKQKYRLTWHYERNALQLSKSEAMLALETIFVTIATASFDPDDKPCRETKTKQDFSLGKRCVERTSSARRIQAHLCSRIRELCRHAALTRGNRRTEGIKDTGAALRYNLNVFLSHCATLNESMRERSWQSDVVSVN
jgi:hypothetical protein